MLFLILIEIRLPELIGEAYYRARCDFDLAVLPGQSGEATGFGHLALLWR